MLRTVCEVNPIKCQHEHCVDTASSRTLTTLFTNLCCLAQDCEHVSEEHLRGEDCDGITLCLHHDMHMHREKLLGRAMPVEMYCSHHIPGHWKAASPRKRKRFIRVHEVNMFQQLMVLKLKATKEGKVVSSQFPPVSTTLGQTVEKLLSAAHAKMSDSLVGSLVVKGTVFGTILVKDYLGTTLAELGILDGSEVEEVDFAVDDLADTDAAEAWPAGLVVMAPNYDNGWGPGMFRSQAVHVKDYSTSSAAEKEGMAFVQWSNFKNYEPLRLGDLPTRRRVAGSGSSGGGGAKRKGAVPWQPGATGEFEVHVNGGWWLALVLSAAAALAKGLRVDDFVLLKWEDAENLDYAARARTTVEPVRPVAGGVGNQGEGEKRGGVASSSSSSSLSAADLSPAQSSLASAERGSSVCGELLPCDHDVGAEEASEGPTSCSSSASPAESTPPLPPQPVRGDTVSSTSLKSAPLARTPGATAASSQPPPSMPFRPVPSSCHVLSTGIRNQGTLPSPPSSFCEDGRRCRRRRESRSDSGSEEEDCHSEQRLRISSPIVSVEDSLLAAADSRPAASSSSSSSSNIAGTNCGAYNFAVTATGAAGTALARSAAASTSPSFPQPFIGGAGGGALPPAAAAFEPAGGRFAQLGELERVFFGGPRSGALLQRLGDLEMEVLGSVQQGKIDERLVRLVSL